MLSMAAATAATEGRSKSATSEIEHSPLLSNEELELPIPPYPTTS